MACCKDGSNDALHAILSKLEEMETKLGLIEINTKKVDEESASIGRKTNKVVLVNVRISISSVADIDTVKQEFTCEFFLAATWEEPALKGRYNAADVDWENKWDPRIYFVNAVEIKNMQRKHKLIRISGSPYPIVQLSYRVAARFKTLFSLRNFPFDHQTLKIEISSKWSDLAVQFDKAPNIPCVLSCSNFLGREEWDLLDHVITRASSTSEDSLKVSLITYSVYTFDFNIRRKYSFYLTNIVFMMFLIALLSFSSFFVNPANTGERLGVILTLLLTAVTFKFVVSQSLPPVSYLTMLDWYVLTSVVFIFLVAMENSLIAKIQTKENQVRADNISWGVAWLTFTAIHVGFLIKSIMIVRTVNRQLEDHQICYRWRNGLISSPEGLVSGTINQPPGMSSSSSPCEYITSKGRKGLVNLDCNIDEPNADTAAMDACTGPFNQSDKLEISCQGSDIQSGTSEISCKDISNLSRNYEKQENESASLGDMSAIHETTNEPANPITHQKRSKNVKFLLPDDIVNLAGKNFTPFYCEKQTQQACKVENVSIDYLREAHCPDFPSNGKINTSADKETGGIELSKIDDGKEPLDTASASKKSGMSLPSADEMPTSKSDVEKKLAAKKCMLMEGTRELSVSELKSGGKIQNGSNLDDSSSSDEFDPTENSNLGFSGLAEYFQDLMKAKAERARSAVLTEPSTNTIDTSESVDQASIAPHNKWSSLDTNSLIRNTFVPSQSKGTSKSVQNCRATAKLMCAQDVSSKRETANLTPSQELPNTNILGREKFAMNASLMVPQGSTGSSDANSLSRNTFIALKYKGTLKPVQIGRSTANPILSQDLSSTTMAAKEDCAMKATSQGAYAREPGNVCASSNSESTMREPCLNQKQTSNIVDGKACYSESSGSDLSDSEITGPIPKTESDVSIVMFNMYPKANEFTTRKEGYNP